jgi:hypothetical protein
LAAYDTRVHFNRRRPFAFWRPRLYPWPARGDDDNAADRVLDKTSGTEPNGYVTGGSSAGCLCRLGGNAQAGDALSLPSSLRRGARYEPDRSDGGVGRARQWGDSGVLPPRKTDGKRLYPCVKSEAPGGMLERRLFHEPCRRPRKAGGLAQRLPCVIPVAQPARHHDQGRKTAASAGPNSGLEAQRQSGL